MSDLRKVFETRDFLINNNIVKNISKLDITLDEFLLILYFINVSSYLNTDDIKDKLGFDEDKAINAFTSLVNKKYIEMIVSNKNGEVIEKINLDPLYDRLLLNSDESKNESDIYSVFEKELGRTLSSYEYELINKWLENGNSEETIKNALKEAILNNVRSFKYIDKIIYDWAKNGVKKRVKDEKSLEEMFEYDWLDENE